MALKSAITTPTEKQFDTFVTLGTHLKARFNWLVRTEDGTLIFLSAKDKGYKVSSLAIVIAVECGDPGKPANGRQIVKKGYVYGGSVKFVCDKNYTLVGANVIYCQAKKSWSSSVPRCLANCRSPDSINHGLKIGKNYTHGKIVRYSCNLGYTLKGEAELTCVDGRWNTATPRCKAVECGNPGKPTNGKQIVRKGYVYGGSVKFVCDKNYTLVGTDVIYCQANRSWSSSVPRCVAVECGDPGKPTNGEQIVKKGYVYGGSVKFVCDKNYTLVGTDVIYCQANRSWSSFVPRCLASCPEPGRIKHGNKIGQNYGHGKTVRYRCNSGYTLEGEDRLTCDDGRWNLDTPRCKEGPHRSSTKLLRRLRKNPPQNTIIAINIRLSKARYRCRKGFVLLGKSMRTCKRGRWIEGGEPKCLDYSSCGVSPVDFRSRIVGGKNSKRGWWPWHVGIYNARSRGTLSDCLLYNFSTEREKRPIILYCLRTA